jgi:hypothetical protein
MDLDVLIKLGPGIWGVVTPFVAERDDVKHVHAEWTLV